MLAAILMVDAAPARDDVHVAAEPVQLGDCHLALELPCGSRRRPKLLPPFERVTALPRLHLHKFPRDFEALGTRELG